MAKKQKKVEPEPAYAAEGERRLNHTPRDVTGLSDLFREELIKLFELSDTLLKTLMTLVTLGEASASDLAKHTGRARATESNNLNQLVRRGYLTRSKRGRVVIFSRRRLKGAQLRPSILEGSEPG